MIYRVLFLCLCTFAYGETCHKQKNSTLKQLENYLNHLPTIKASFLQKNSDNPVVSGTLYIDKNNGRMHIDYPDLQQKITVRNGTLYLADATDNSVQDISASYTPAGLLLQKNIRFDDTVYVLKFTETQQNAFLTLASTKNGDEGQMTIEFTLKPFVKLKKWDILDPQGNEIHVDITKFEAGVTLDKHLFDRPEF